MNRNSVQYLLGAHPVPGVRRSSGYKNQSPNSKDLSLGQGTGHQRGTGEKLARWGFHPQGMRSTPGKGNPAGAAHSGMLAPSGAEISGDTKSQCVQRVRPRNPCHPNRSHRVLVMEGGLTARSSAGRQPPRPQQRVAFTWIIKVTQLYLQFNTEKNPGDV